MRSRKRILKDPMCMQSRRMTASPSQRSSTWKIFGFAEPGEGIKIYESLWGRTFPPHSILLY